MSGPCRGARAGRRGRRSTARQVLSDCDARLARYRQALESGVDPAVVGRWIGEVQAERRKAEQELRSRRRGSMLSEEEIVALVKSLGDVVGVLDAADPQKMADLYESLGLTLTYQPRDKKVLVEADLSSMRMVRVGGATRPPSTPPLVRGELSLTA